MNCETVMEDLKSFWEIVVDVWQQGIFGIQIGKVLTAVFAPFSGSSGSK
jgi:hypothetical protein